MLGNCILLTEEGMFRLTKPVPIAGGEAILRKVACTLCSSAMNVFTLRDQPVRIAVGTDITHAAVQLNEIKLNTFFRVQGEEMLLPMFQRTSDTMEMTLSWEAPKDMKLFFAVSSSPAPKGWVAKQWFLFATSTKDKGFFKLPLPNVYEDARICMGREFSIKGDSIQDVLEKSLRHFEAAPWNTDLMPNLADLTHKVFRFHPSTLKALPAHEGNWTPFCRKVNRAELEALLP